MSEHVALCEPCCQRYVWWYAEGVGALRVENNAAAIELARVLTAKVSRVQRAARTKAEGARHLLIPLGSAHTRYPELKRSWWYEHADEIPGIARMGGRTYLRIPVFEQWLFGGRGTAQERPTG